VTVPVAVAALVPANVAWSVTAVPAGTEIDVPDGPPPDREVESDVEAAELTVTVSAATLQAVVIAALLVSAL
jgi:hypothetical protein